MDSTMTREKQRSNWYTIMEYGSITAIDNLRDYISQLEEENAILKEHAVEWHDLRKDPNDLPKVKGQYWTKYNDCNEEKGGYYDIHYFDPDNPAYKQMWYKFDVIAWCELPRFKESEE